jgi:hypothetical protein
MLIKILQSEAPCSIINEFWPASKTEMKPSTERKKKRDGVVQKELRFGEGAPPISLPKCCC